MEFNKYMDWNNYLTSKGNFCDTETMISASEMDLSSILGSSIVYYGERKFLFSNTDVALCWYI